MGVAPCTLILGGVGAGAAATADRLDGSVFFPLTALPLLELAAEGGGLFNRGDTGHCGVESPEPPAPVLRAPPRPGSFDTASVTPPLLLPDICGTLLADNALCMAAADGCPGKLEFDTALGRLSFRIGEALREVLGLPPGNGECE